MNIFDKSFNEIDPASGRPISYGHPDGVWFISIVQGFLCLFLLLGAAYVHQIANAGDSVYYLAVVIVIMTAFLVRALFRRSENAITILWIMAAVEGLWVVAVLYSKAGAVYIPLLKLLCDVICLTYTFGLKRDRFLSSNSDIR